MSWCMRVVDRRRDSRKRNVGRPSNAETTIDHWQSQLVPLVISRSTFMMSCSVDRMTSSYSDRNRPVLQGAMRNEYRLRQFWNRKAVAEQEESVMGVGQSQSARQTTKLLLLGWNTKQHC